MSKLLVVTHLGLRYFMIKEMKIKLMMGENYNAFVKGILRG